MVGLLVGMVVSGSLSPTTALSAPPVVARPAAATLATAPLLGPVALPGAVNFADIAEKLNPVVVNIDASARGRRARSTTADPRRRPDPLDEPTDERRPRGNEAPRRGTGTGFIIDDAGAHPHQPSRHRGRRTADGEAGRRPQPARLCGRLRPRYGHCAHPRGRRPASCPPRCSAIPTTCGWASGSWPSATRWPTSTPSRSGSSASSAGSSSTRASTTTSRPTPRSASATAAAR